MIHVKARSSPYPGSQVKRFPVHDDNVSWSREWAEYDPVDYTAECVKAGPEWADPDFRESDQLKHAPRFNELDGRIDRRSYLGVYELDKDNLPRNPMGRTGMISRGLLGKWGPNHAADPIVTRWKREGGEKVIHKLSGKPILQFISIKRKDCGQWAIPGGMVDAGEHPSTTLKREFGEEALNSLRIPRCEKDRIRKQFQAIFSKENAVKIYAGYVDDPRNTDSAWIETVAVNFHDDTGNSVGDLNLHAGDDAEDVQWCDIDKNLQLYASHLQFLKSVTELWGGHW
ncbi:ADP-ribose pyrophosphatase, mitochondrial-like isoform X2 [Pristis pectinata]|nr:ADP-ribose pyrophosphatase, mitochondrial-like isoform X2 [Pristis pectinata]XP_051878376.1 ADP-ribose pyrophosphatase, mitochondrial-like isoform X2 [Pristis pectinata]